MDELLSEKEQIERIREWWRDNGWFLVGGLALGAIAWFGLIQYHKHQDAQAIEAEALYVEVRDALGDNDRDAAAMLVEQLREEYGSSPYTDQAGLILARAYLVTDTGKAAQELRYVMENSGDAELSLIARLRLARVLIYQMKEQDALNLLAVDEPGQFAAQIDEIRGDAYVALGDDAAARTAYGSALTAPGADWLNRNFLEMKLASLGPGEDAAPGSGARSASPSPAPAPGTDASTAPAGAAPRPAGDAPANAPAGDAPAAGPAGDAAAPSADAPAAGPAGDAPASAPGGNAPAGNAPAPAPAGE